MNMTRRLAALAATSLPLAVSAGQATTASAIVWNADASNLATTAGATSFNEDPRADGTWSPGATDMGGGSSGSSGGPHMASTGSSGGSHVATRVDVPGNGMRPYFAPGTASAPLR